MCESTIPAPENTAVTVPVELPPNYLLVRIPVHIQQESYNWYERLEGCKYAVAGDDFEIVADTLDDKHAALLAFQAENSDAFPDGTSALESQIAARFEKQREAYAEAQKPRKSLDLFAPKEDG